MGVSDAFLFLEDDALVCMRASGIFVARLLVMTAF